MGHKFPGVQPVLAFPDCHDHHLYQVAHALQDVLLYSYLEDPQDLNNTQETNTLQRMFIKMKKRTSTDPQTACSLVKYADKENFIFWKTILVVNCLYNQHGTLLRLFFKKSMWKTLLIKNVFKRKYKNQLQYTVTLYHIIWNHQGMSERPPIFISFSGFGSGPIIFSKCSALHFVWIRCC